MASLLELRIARKDMGGGQKTQLFDLPNEVSDFPTGQIVIALEMLTVERFWFISWTNLKPNHCCNTELSATDFKT